MQPEVHHNTDMQDCEAHLEYIEPKVNKEWANDWVVSTRATCSGSLRPMAVGSCVHTHLSLTGLLALTPVIVSTEEQAPIVLATHT
jgi:hypothetical protein